jgi:proteasome lid subunit RPN8/RPN11
MSDFHQLGDGTGPATPVLLKLDEAAELPRDERVFYVLAGNGIFIARNHEFFHSCVEAERGPSELAEQKPFLRVNFPMIPQELFERAVGFFDQVAERHGSEAALVLVWDRDEECVRLVAPEQRATMSKPWRGYSSPIGVHYVPPADLPRSWVPFGDIHSHVDYAAYSSSTDKHDELHSAGLHIVVGHISKEPPQVHVEAVVDGARFTVKRELVIEGYQQRRGDVPAEWMDQLTIEVESWGGVPQ